MNHHFLLTKCCVLDETPCMSTSHFLFCWSEARKVSSPLCSHNDWLRARPSRERRKTWRTSLGGPLWQKHTHACANPGLCLPQRSVLCQLELFSCHLRKGSLKFSYGRFFVVVVFFNECTVSCKHFRTDLNFFLHFCPASIYYFFIFWEAV